MGIREVRWARPSRETNEPYPPKEADGTDDRSGTGRTGLPDSHGVGHEDEGWHEAEHRYGGWRGDVPDEEYRGERDEPIGPYNIGRSGESRRSGGNVARNRSIHRVRPNEQCIRRTSCRNCGGSVEA